MNRNTSSHFSASDNQIHIGRSTFNRDSWYKTTFNAGDLIPFYVDEVLPGDTFDMKTSLVARMATPIVPVMDNAYLDTYFFFVPNRLVWDHWKEFNGESKSAWTAVTEYEVPQFPLAARSDYSLADYFGLPVFNEIGDNVDFFVQVNALPFRAYALVWNEWFRDQNLQDEIFIDTGDVVNLAQWRELNYVRKVNKFHDYFTSALPAPQKGPAVLIPGLNDLDGIPVVTSSKNNFPNAAGMPDLYLGARSGGLANNTYYDLTLKTDGSGRSIGRVQADGFNTDADHLQKGLAPLNLVTGSSANVVSGATIDALRTAFQIQKLLWRDGNGGTRYTEIIRSHFGVVSPDARQQRPEYLGGKRVPLTMNQVIQQSAVDAQPTPLGNTGGYSKTVDSFNGFQKSFTEHGFIIGVCCVRTDHTYQNGINRMWSRRDRFDYYYPELANIGEQPILNKEIYLDSATIRNGVYDEVFGYQEAWAEYRYRPSYVTGAFRSNASNGSLDIWHYADDYQSQPYLSADWIAEPLENLNRSLAVPSSGESHEQILLDMFFDLKTTRPMPVYSVPGLVDHF